MIPSKKHLSSQSGEAKVKDSGLQHFSSSVFPPEPTRAWHRSLQGWANARRKGSYCTRSLTCFQVGSMLGYTVPKGGPSCWPAQNGFGPGSHCGALPRHSGASCLNEIAHLRGPASNGMHCAPHSALKGEWMDPGKSVIATELCMHSTRLPFHCCREDAYLVCTC